MTSRSSPIIITRVPVNLMQQDDNNAINVTAEYHILTRIMVHAMLSILDRTTHVSIIWLISETAD